MQENKKTYQSQLQLKKEFNFVRDYYGITISEENKGMKLSEDEQKNLEKRLEVVTGKWWKLVLEQIKTWRLVDSDKLKIDSIPLPNDKQIKLDELKEEIESISSQLGIRPPFARVGKIDADSYKKKLWREWPNNYWQVSKRGGKSI